MRKTLVIIGLAVLAALPALAGSMAKGSCCASMSGVERSVANLDNGVRITLTASDPKVLAALQDRAGNCGQGDCPNCPMNAKGVTRTVEKTSNGVVITATSSDPAQVKALQEHAAAMKSGACCKGKMGKGCMHGKGGPAAQKS